MTARFGSSHEPYSYRGECIVFISAWARTVVRSAIRAVSGPHSVDRTTTVHAFFMPFSNTI